MRYISTGKQNDFCTPTSVAALFTTTKAKNQTRCPAADAEIRKMRQSSCDGCSPMDQPGGHVAD